MNGTGINDGRHCIIQRSSHGARCAGLSRWEVEFPILQLPAENAVRGNAVDEWEAHALAWFDAATVGSCPMTAFDMPLPVNQSKIDFRLPRTLPH